MQGMVEVRANRTTARAVAFWKSEGPGEFAPISARPVFSVAMLRTATGHLISNKIRRSRMVPLGMIAL
jgi:hypothetical protein